MKACILIAAAADRAAELAAALGDLQTMRTSDPLRAELLATVGCFQAVIVADGFLPHLDEAALGESPLIRVEATTRPSEIAAMASAVIRRARNADRGRASTLEHLTALPYSAYLDLVRFRATRRYLLGLMERHRGSVTEASLTAGLARESLHRQLRRHDVDPDAFREAHAER